MNTTDSEDGPSDHARVTVALRTVGCKLNQAESDALAHRFLQAGYTLVSPTAKPDVFILNTCTVTHIADRKCRQYLREFNRRNPDSLVLAVGCYADRDAAGLSEVEGVDLIIGNADKERIPEMVADRLNKLLGGNGHHLSQELFRTRPMVKIQEGCSHYCSYCVVPLVRGREKSVPVGTVITEIRTLVNEGFKEVVLTGTRIGAHDDARGLVGLLGRILDQTSMPRIHLSSLQPAEITSNLIDLWQSDTRICRHLHLALQSGSDAVLRRMNREYSIDEYEATVNRMREAMPDVAVTTDIIVGFPSEGNAEFEQSYRFCKEIAFADMHVFPYSSRPGTAAARMKGKVSEADKKTRSRVMLELAESLGRNFRSQFKGQTRSVLWEERKGSDLWIGHTDNYLKVVTHSNQVLANRILQTRIAGECQDAVWGSVQW